MSWLAPAALEAPATVPESILPVQVRRTTIKQQSTMAYSTNGTATIQAALLDRQARIEGTSVKQPHLTTELRTQPVCIIHLELEVAVGWQSGQGAQQPVAMQRCIQSGFVWETD